MPVSSERGNERTAPYGLAMAVRVITVPPFMVSLLLLLLYNRRSDIFRSPVDLLVSFCCLALLPVLAYPLARLIPALKKKGREMERTLAMVLSAVGYAIVFVYSLVAGCTHALCLICTTYFASVLIILFCNKVLRLRASGHGCSITGPIILACFFLWDASRPGGSMVALTVGFLLWGVILWSSLVTRRHTVSEFLLGTAVCILAFTVSWAIWTV